MDRTASSELWNLRLEDFRKFCRFLFFLYYITSVPFRCSFQLDFSFSKEYLLLLLVDYAADLFFLIEFFFILRREKDTYIRLSPEIKIIESEKFAANISSEGLSGQKSQISRDGHRLGFTSVLHSILSITCLLPFEGVVAAAGYKYFVQLRLMRLYLVVNFFDYWSDIVDILENYQFVSSMEGVRAISFSMATAMIAHIAACIYFGIAIRTMTLGNPVSWISKDNLAYWDSESMKIVFKTSTNTCYLRSLYWSVETVITVGYGDIVAYTDEETWFCILYFLFAAFLTYFSVSNFELLITNLDSSLMDHLIKVSRFQKYAKYRHLPLDIINRVKSYYEYQWRLLGGVDEQKILLELPSNLSNQINQSILRNLFQGVEHIKVLKRSLMNALISQSKIIPYSPDDIIVSPDTSVQGVYIVLSGELEVGLESFGKTRILQCGDVFGMKALNYDYLSRDYLKAKSFAEVVFISRTKFKATCKGHMSEAELAKWFKNMTSYYTQISHAKEIPTTSPNFLTLSNRMGGSDNISWIRRYSKTIFWDTAILLVLLFFLFATSLLLAGTMRDTFFQNFFGILVASYIGDVLMLINLFGRMFYFNIMDNGIAITKPKQIFQHFLRTENVSLEILAHIPIDVFLAFGLGANVIPIVRILKLLHIKHLNVYLQRLSDTLYSLDVFSFSFEVRRCWQLFFYLILSCHWAGCIWLLTADVSTKVFNCNINWKLQDINNPLLSIDNSFMNNWTPYFRSIYWALSGMTSIAFSDILPTNYLENIVIIIILFFGCQILSGLDAGIASLITSFGRDKQEFRLMVERARGILQFNKIPFEVESQVLRYYEYIWDRYNGIDEKDILRSIPTSLRGSVANYFMKPIIQNIPFFANCDDAMLEMLFALLQPRVFLKDDCIVMFGEYGKEMFIIEKGKVEVTDVTRKIRYKILTSGDYIGESALLMGSPRTASTYTLTYCDTFVLSKGNFLKVADLFPNEFAQMRSIIEDIISSKSNANSSVNALAASDNLGQNGSRVDDVTTRSNVLTSESTADVTTTASSLFASNKVVPSDIPVELVNVPLHPDSLLKGAWDSFLFFLLLYIAFMMPIRIAFIMYPLSYIIDYSIDFVFLINSYLNCTVFPTFSLGELVIDPGKLRKLYYQSNLMFDICAGIPFDILALVFVNADAKTLSLARGVLRLPKILRFRYFPIYANHFENILSYFRINAAFVRFAELIGAIVLLGVYCACGYYLIASTGSSDCIAEEGAAYGNACQYRGTWLQYQIYLRRIQENGGDQIDRFTMAMNWAIPLLTKETLADVMPVNEKESFYIFIVMVLGVVVNGAILGAAISLISNESDTSLSLEVKIDHLTAQTAESHLQLSTESIEKATGYLKYLMSISGSMLQYQEQIFQQLPHSLSRKINYHLKTNVLKKCDLFNHLGSEVTNSIATHLELKIFCLGDRILINEEIGETMYFVEKGAVDVLSESGDVLNTLFAGSFFGETGLFFKEPRTATIQVKSSLCICYALSKANLEYELKNYDFDAALTLETFAAIKSSNAIRNSAISKNLGRAQTIMQGKIGRLLDFKIVETIISEKSYLKQMRKILHPHSKYRFYWDFIGLLCISYYAFTIPIVGALVFGENLVYYINFIVFDFIIDMYWIFDIILKAKVFSCYENKYDEKLSIDDAVIWSQYYQSYFIIDVISSLPLEIFACIPNLPPVSVYLLRMHHLFRVFQIFDYANKIHENCLHILGWAPSHALTMVFKAGYVYLIAAHWLTCLYFMIHRYLESESELTFATVDSMASYSHETGRHNICEVSVSRCYSRSLYFVLSTLTSIGYGDIIPYGNLELVWQIAVSLIGSFLGAMFGGYCSAYLKSVNASSDFLYRKKIAHIKRYIKFRKLDDKLGSAILTQYEYMWRNYHMCDELTDLLSDLSEPTHADISFELNKRVIDLMPLFADYASRIQRRFAAIMRPQIILAGNFVFSHGDVDSNIYIVSRGKLRVTLVEDSVVDDENSKSLPLLKRKHHKHGKIYLPGHHFGEYGMISASSSRSENASAIHMSEVFSIKDEEFWHMLNMLKFSERKRLVVDLMTVIGDEHHTAAEVDFDFNPGPLYSSSLHKFSMFVLKEILKNSTGSIEDFEDSDEELDATAQQTKRLKMFIVDHRRGSVTADLVPQKRKQGLTSAISAVATLSMTKRRFSFSSQGVMTHLTEKLSVELNGGIGMQRRRSVANRRRSSLISNPGDSRRSSNMSAGGSDVFSIMGSDDLED